jgi:hypothetical protein
MTPTTATTFYILQVGTDDDVQPEESNQEDEVFSEPDDEIVLQPSTSQSRVLPWLVKW